MFVFKYNMCVYHKQGYLALIQVECSFVMRNFFPKDNCSNQRIIQIHSRITSLLVGGLALFAKFKPCAAPPISSS